MSLAGGTMVGPYEILSLRGVGGMGEVYRARDTRLDRTVAVKILPPGLADDPTRRARFEREARTISALSHPNICALFDIGNADGNEYLVMEYLEGDTLAERIARGPLPASLVLRYGIQIAAALQHAHRAGIVHRDLKPGNIMITAGGAKLLDFGLAKAVDPRMFSDQSASDTQVAPLTVSGTVVGTTQYMSPEQLGGSGVDHRTDLFALGVILYEMTTGKRPFQSESRAGLISAILASDPVPVRSLQPSVSPALERIIVTALEKNPDDRWQTAQDIGRQLRWISESSSTATAEPALPRNRSLPPAAMLAIVGIAAVLATWSATRIFSTRAAPARNVSLQFALPADLENHRSSELIDFVLSPDGETVAIVAVKGGTAALFLRRMDSFAFEKIEHTEGASSPFWSSDGAWLGFSARGKLWKTQITGGAPPQAICDITPFGARASWNGETILFSDSRGDRKEIYRVSAAGGAPVKVTAVKPGEWRHSWPTLLSDGKHFLYLAFGTGTLERQLVLASLDSSARSVLATNVSFARLSGRDRLVYVRDASLLSQRFDEAKGITTGEPVIIAADVSYFYPTARADFDASPSGVVVYRTNTSSGRLFLANRGGATIRTLDDKELFWDHALSPDGRKAAVSVESRSTGLMDIWIYDIVRGVRDRFTSDPAIEVSPAWSPDGRSLVYSQGEGGAFPHLVERSLDGSSLRDLTPRGTFQFSANFAPDGESIYFTSDAGGSSNIDRYSVKSRTSAPFLQTTFAEGSPAVSPDGKWLAFTSNTTGVHEAYIQSLTGETRRLRISDTGASMPRWRTDSRELYFVRPDGTVMSVTPGASGNWEETTATELFHLPDELRGFDVEPDGKSFLISTWKAGPNDDLLHVVMTGQ